MDNFCIKCNKSISKNAKKCNSCNAKGRFMSKETRLKLRNINLGKKYSEETNRKKSLAMMGHKVSKETVRKIFEARTKNNSWKQSEEAKKKISNTHKRLYSKGKMKAWNKGLTKETSESLIKLSKGMLGENNPNWKDGKSKIQYLVRNNRSYLKWRSDVFKRDNYHCQCCGVGSVKIQAHHIIPIRVIIDYFNLRDGKSILKCKLLWDVGNGITYCVPCHYKLDGYINKNIKLRNSL
jgi:hypothetical protein